MGLPMLSSADKRVVRRSIEPFRQQRLLRSLYQSPRPDKRNLGSRQFTRFLTEAGLFWAEWASRGRDGAPAGGEEITAQRPVGGARRNVRPK